MGKANITAAPSGGGGMAGYKGSGKRAMPPKAKRVTGGTSVRLGQLKPAKRGGKGGKG